MEQSTSSMDSKPLERKILDRTGQNLGDIDTEQVDLGPELVEVHYTNTRLRQLPCLTRLENIEVRFFLICLLWMYIQYKSYCMLH